jgi:lytic cellulose monooxygenase (C1-hydroxylating)
MATRITTSAVLLAVFAASWASAHGHVSDVFIKNESYYGHDPTKVPWGPQPDSISWTNGADDNGPVLSSATDLSSHDIICHLNATNGVLSAPVAAGTTITVRWSDWPEAHWGPVIDYMARCTNDDCTTADKTELRFFKIAELGQLSRGTVPGTPGHWANNQLRDGDFSWNITIPAELAPGSYVLRHEIIALHPGGAEGSTQMYPQCINLVVEGSGTALPEGILATELYSSTDPGLLHNVFVDEWSDAEYILPGPPVTKF